MTPSPSPSSAVRAAVDELRDFAEWLVSMDDPDPFGPGMARRRTVTLTEIIDRARAALALAAVDVTETAE